MSHKINKDRGDDDTEDATQVAHCTGATIETYGCHCIVETELIQLG